MRFFRIIRQALLSDNKIKKYVTYAFGEIILVVIGILIALAINNINQEHNIRKKEKVYLEGLQKELETSKNKLQELIKINHANYEGAKRIVYFIENPDSLISEEQFSELIFNSLAFDIAFNPNNSLLNEMINSGSLKDISNNQLRVYLTNWISTLDDVAKQEVDLEKQREKVINILSGEEYSIKTIFDFNQGIKSQIDLPTSKITRSNLKILASPEFENNLIMFILSAFATEQNHYIPLQDELDRMIELITVELSK
ncbi:DUF6090 family protein [Carboxylicivirga caseinilyticus]|uniref:DUF6090 family protein n=1 Tax=Carboxylicivirga caseinilyticus TaxID=3417572 RepID=UPI003D326392|nr:hypothetical protein [Marinilabiliaceae bacterium A049]